jgi:7,8-dihydroneopterin aldolase/epimerase/oxygenase
MLTKGTQILSLTGLRFNANLGILDHEKSAPQAIQVDVDLNMGSQPLKPDEDEIRNVLDYRKVHTLIIDTCTQQHINLLESLTGKLCVSLMQLPNVLGARVRIVKLDIFDDCEVSINQEVGQW